MAFILNHFFVVILPYCFRTVFEYDKFFEFDVIPYTRKKNYTMWKYFKNRLKKHPM